MTNLDKFRADAADYLTFYHEIGIPQHPFFLGEANNDADYKMAVVSSPGRMGNHALISMLDNHPSLPRIPGEDSFLTNLLRIPQQAIHDFFRELRGNDPVSYLKRFSALNLEYEKWREHKRHHDEQKVPEVYAGIQGTLKSVVSDYEGVVFDLDYDRYDQTLREREEALRGAGDAKTLLTAYLEAFRKLDREDRTTPYHGMIAGSGMRVQCRWLAERFDKVRIITSLRPFESYAVTHLKSYHNATEPTEELIQEAWEYWFHKVVDYLFIKAAHPEKILLVPYQEIALETRKVAEQLCAFLEIPFHENMLEATVYGRPVRGNSSVSRGGENHGQFYVSDKRIDSRWVPEACTPLWEAAELLFYDRWNQPADRG